MHISNEKEEEILTILLVARSHTWGNMEPNVAEGLRPEQFFSPCIIQLITDFN